MSAHDSWFWEMTDWDDIRLFLELAREGSLSAAARRLKVDHSTVARRVSALEKRLGLRLFDRLARGYVLTEEGETLLGAAERMETEAIALQRQASGRPAAPGNVRLNTSPMLASLFLAPRLVELQRRHPEIRVALSGNNRVVDLNRREADIALRLAKPAEAGLIARRMGSIGFGLYASPDYLAATRPKDYGFIGYDDMLGQISQQQWLEQQAAGRPIVFLCSDMTTMFHTACAGMGVAVLPHFAGTTDPRLRAVPADTTAPDREIWLMVHPDLRRAPRVRIVMDFLAALFARERRMLEQGAARTNRTIRRRALPR
ncbi:MAG: LysR family transcriptional regulator [Ferrovibrio sp.]